MKPVAESTVAEAEPKPFVVASAGDPTLILVPEKPSVQTATAGTDDPLPQDTLPQNTLPQEARTAPSRIEIVGECLVVEPCIDQYLYALYERTPKEDTIKETEKRKVEVKRKGKLVTVTRSFTKLVDNDFTWKDPNAAERVGMSMSDYVIGGMDKSFKLKLFRMLQAAENAGLQPGITSAFRDDYRQVDRKRPEGGKQPVVSRRQPPRRLWPRACRRYRERQRRRSRSALDIRPKRSGNGSMQTENSSGSADRISASIHRMSARSTARNMCPAAAAPGRRPPM